MKEIVQSFTKVIEKCSSLLQVNLLTKEEINFVQNIKKNLQKNTYEFNTIVASKKELTAKDFERLGYFLTIIVEDLDRLYSLMPVISKRYFAIIEEAKEA